MLVIRLFRTGKKNRPAFKIVVIDKRKASTHGRVVEEVGFYNPLTKEKVLKADRVKYWLSVGAKPSNTLHNFLVSEKIIEGKKIDVHKRPHPVEDGEGKGPEEKKPVLTDSVPVTQDASAKEATVTGKETVPEKGADGPAGESRPVEESEKGGKPKKEKPLQEPPAKEKTVE